MLLVKCCVCVDRNLVLILVGCGVVDGLMLCNCVRLLGFWVLICLCLLSLMCLMVLS